MLKLYVVVRGDLPAGDQAVQASHALADFASAHPAEFKRWNTTSNTFILLEARNESHLRSLVEKAQDGEFKFTPFTESDYKFSAERGLSISGSLTAVAFAPNWLVQNVMLADLPLALRKQRRFGKFRKAGKR